LADRGWRVEINGQFRKEELRGRWLERRVERKEEVA
jgi:hypothetical protein